MPSDVAEGQDRRTTAEFLPFLSIAYGSLKEVETRLRIARRLGDLDDPCTSGGLDLAAEVGRLLGGLITSLERKTQLTTHEPRFFFLPTKHRSCPTSTPSFAGAA